ncbi:MAG: tetratricopeptide repeat protein [Candidatus Methylomirabilales bacterium]
MSRINALTEMLADDPTDPLLYFMLASEYFNAGALEEAVRCIETYLEKMDDEGAAYRILAQALQQLGRREEARRAYQRGIEAARRHEHDSMVEEYQEALAALD